MSLSDFAEGLGLGCFGLPAGFHSSIRTHHLLSFDQSLALHQLPLLLSDDLQAFATRIMLAQLNLLVIMHLESSHFCEWVL
jgi:hypothetical protein